MLKILLYYSIYLAELKVVWTFWVKPTFLSLIKHIFFLLNPSFYIFLNNIYFMSKVLLCFFIYKAGQLERKGCMMCSRRSNV